MTDPRSTEGATAGLDLDAIEARLATATPGPWRCSMLDGWITIDVPGVGSGMADGDLIAHAPDDLRALLAEPPGGDRFPPCEWGVALGRWPGVSRG